MAKSHISKEKTSLAEGGAGGLATVEAFCSSSAAGQDDIARLAYSYWLARGCPEGSAEQDWFRAEQEIRHQHGSKSR